MGAALSKVNKTFSAKTLPSSIALLPWKQHINYILICKFSESLYVCSFAEGVSSPLDLLEWHDNPSGTETICE